MIPTGKYTLQPCNSHYSVDQYGYMLQDGYHGTGDAILRNYMAWIAYEDKKLLHVIPISQRHPLNHTPMSRDHMIYSLCAHSVMKFDLKYLVEYMIHDVKNRHRITLSLKCWMYALAGNKTSHFWYLILELLTVNLYYRPIHWLGYKIAGWCEEVDQDDWRIFDTFIVSDKKTKLQEQSKLNQLIDKIVFPSYALHFSGHQLRVLPNRFPRLTRWLKRSYGAMVGKTNYAQRLLFNLPVTEEQVRNYRPMSKNRWTGYLNGRNDRYMVEIPEQEYNNIDRDYLIALWNER
jgi:hypothetical protein